ncbi:hypothetical protein N7520_004241 [Penicillium odoratum]|uniref:uncharacterized protein n=1 Tax=Penicillium odoratum TaxID=1167516 RepID=UPI0025496462|nr:uncharacterized protein N7520_004241 [Penicillium odoratum]KAJ5769682.1 hypothetical protein N7520_004241 [Penicillium odoratum]
MPAKTSSACSKAMTAKGEPNSTEQYQDFLLGSVHGRRLWRPGASPLINHKGPMESLTKGKTWEGLRPLSENADLF